MLAKKKTVLANVRVIMNQEVSLGLRLQLKFRDRPGKLKEEENPRNNDENMCRKGCFDINYVFVFFSCHFFWATNL